MTEAQIVLIWFGLAAAVYAGSVFIAKQAWGRWPFFFATFGGGVLVSLLDENTMPVLPFLAICIFTVSLHGYAVGARCIDAGLSKLHAVWAWIPIVYLGMLIPTPKGQNVLAERNRASRVSPAISH